MGHDGRLDSWKEIATYLERDERTVQRWEMERKLPVHRLPGGRRGGVYAFRQELDAWRTADRDTASADGAPVETFVSVENPNFQQVSLPTEVDLPEECHDIGGEVAANAARRVPNPTEAATITESPHTDRSSLSLSILILVLGLGLLGLGAVGGFLFAHRHSAGTGKMEMQRLTFRHGSIRSARFRPDGRNVVYGARWSGQPLELFESGVERPESFSLQIRDSQLLAVSSRSMLAILTNLQSSGPFIQIGTLATRELYTGQPQTIAENVTWADWAPDGSSIAYTVLDPNKGGSWIRIYSPDLHQVRRLSPATAEAEDWFSHVRFSPNGKLIAYEEHRWTRDDGRAVILDLRDGRQINSRDYDSIYGLAWRPSGDEIWFSAAETGLSRSVWRMNKIGREGLVYQVPANLTVQDISGRGDLLVTRNVAQSSVLVEKLKGEQDPTNLSVFDWSALGDLSRDGKQITFDETGEAVRSPALYLRDISGSTPTLLGNATTPAAISPHGDAVLAVTNSMCQQIVLFPRSQPSRTVTRPGLCVYGFFWQSENEIVFNATEGNKKVRCYLEKIGEPDAVAFTQEGIRCMLRSPDGKHTLTFSNGTYFQTAVPEGTSQRLTKLNPAYRPIGWLRDNRIAIIRNRNPFTIGFVDIESGRSSSRLVRTPPDVENVFTVRISPDATTLAYTAYQLNSDLYFLHGLK